MLVEKYLNSFKRKIQLNIHKYFKGHHNKHARYASFAVVALFIAVVIGYNTGIKPPRDFPAGALVEIKSGMTLSSISAKLYKDDVIRSRFLFETVVRILAGDRGVLYGQYYFDIPETLFGVSARMTQGRFGLDPIRITIPEGATIADIAEVLNGKLPSFPKEEFIVLARDLEKEGYLFPDTYFFLPNIEPKQIIKEMAENFNTKWSTLSDEFPDSENSREDIVIMASIIEKEASWREDKALVSGILWKRISIGMPLQVDAPFIYERNKNTFELSTEDLRTDSPYNTYTNKGLTPTPIANPGLDSIIAALSPQESPYLFYLSDKKGVMHYARNFEEHKRNKRLYLN